MKTSSRLFVSAFLILLSSCVKTAPVRDVEFSSTGYAFLGTYDSSGKPGYLLNPDSISDSLLSFISTSLPDAKNLAMSRPDLFSGSSTADIVVNKTTDIYLTFVSAGAGFTNSIAFYNYPTAQPPASTADIKTITYIFPNAGSQTPLVAGDKVKIGTFAAGTTVGFLLLENAWNLSTHSLNNNVVHFCSDDILNPEQDPNIRRHAVLMNFAFENKVLISFEDTDRTDPQCDNDFNDVVIYCSLSSLP